jgi:hypothetical protein
MSEHCVPAEQNIIYSAEVAALLIGLDRGRK